MKIMKFVKNPGLVFFSLGRRGLLNWLPDRIYLKIAYRVRMGKSLDLNNPQRFTEKLQWLKLYNRRDEYTDMVDKYQVKQLVSKAVGDKYLIKTIGVWESFDEIDFNVLPNKFVLKCTHDSGGVVICKDKTSFDKNKAKRLLEKSLKRNYYYSGREWPYKNVKPRIIAEEYLDSLANSSLVDYKIFCINGEPSFVLVCTGAAHSEERKYDWFDLEFNSLPFRSSRPSCGYKLEKPDNFDEMLYVAKKLSENIPLIRVDLYNISGKVYFGELTFFNESGLQPFYPDSWDYKLGKMIDLKCIE